MRTLRDSKWKEYITQIIGYREWIFLAERMGRHDATGYIRAGTKSESGGGNQRWRVEVRGTEQARVSKLGMRKYFVRLGATLRLDWTQGVASLSALRPRPLETKTTP